MPKTRRLTSKDDEMIYVEQQLTYITGSGNGYLEAFVTVIEIGTTGCMVSIDEILTQGEQGTLMVGEYVFARWSELEISIP